MSTSLNQFLANGWTGIHDTMLAYCNERHKIDLSFSQAECRKAFLSLPEDIRQEALSWGWDTVNRDSALNHWVENGCEIVDNRAALLKRDSADT
jgi:hypothetical protein